MDTHFTRLLTYQLLLIMTMSVAFLFGFGRSAALAVWFGGVVAATNVLLLIRCARRELKPGFDPAKQTLLVAYSCAATRFVTVAVGFVLGMGVLKLYPLALMSGFIAGQLVLFFPGTRKILVN